MRRCPFSNLQRGKRELYIYCLSELNASNDELMGVYIYVGMLDYAHFILFFNNLMIEINKIIKYYNFCEIKI